MVCGGTSVRRNGHMGLNRRCFGSWKCLFLGRKLEAWRWKFSSCFCLSLLPIFWIQNIPKVIPTSKERNRIRPENVYAFGPYFSQRDFSYIKCAFLENDWLSDKASFDRAYRIIWRHRTTVCPSLLRQNTLTWCYKSWLRSLLLDSDNDSHWCTVSRWPCTFAFSSFSRHSDPHSMFCSNYWASHLCQWIFEFIADFLKAYSHCFELLILSLVLTLLYYLLHLIHPRILILRCRLSHYFDWSYHPLCRFIKFLYHAHFRIVATFLLRQLSMV